jgi:L-lactate utilization protein LutC
VERTAFLARLRAAAGSGPPPPNLPHPIEPVDAIPPVVYLSTGEPAPEVFARMATAHAWNVRRVDDDAGLLAVVDEVCVAEEVRRVVLSADQEVAGLLPHQQGRGVEVLPGRAPADAATADLGITGAVYGLAATGSVVVAADRAGGRSVSLLPPVHLAVVAASRVVASASEVWRQVPERFPQGLPSQLVFISGPSRSADIEFTLTVGVHGPKRVWLALLDHR